MDSHLLALYAQQHHAQIAQGVALLFGYFSSHIVAWTTHWSAPPKIKAALAIGVALVGGTVASVGWAPGQPWYDWVKAVVFAIVASQSGYLLRHVPVIGAAAIQGTGLNLGAVPGAPDAPPPAVTPGVNPALPDADGGGVVVVLIGAVLLVIGAVLLLVAALAKPAELSVPGLVLLLLGIVLLVIEREYQSRLP